VRLRAPRSPSQEIESDAEASPQPHQQQESPEAPLGEAEALGGPEGDGSRQLARLHDEVWEFAMTTQGVQQSQHVEVTQVVALVGLVVAQLWPEAEVHLYGSRCYGTSLPESDIDIVVTCIPDGEGPARHSRSLAEALGGQGWVARAFALDRAAVPVVKLETTLDVSNLKADISFGGGSRAMEGAGRGRFRGHSGLAMGGMMCGLRGAMPALGPLVCVLKQYLVERGLNEPYTGGLSSICLSCMVASYIAQLREGTPYPTSEETNLGAMLQGFLAHFGSLDYSQHGVYVHRGTGEKPPAAVHSELFVEDPLQPGSCVNLAGSTFAMDRVKDAFWHANLALQGESCGGHSCGCQGHHGYQIPTSRGFEHDSLLDRVLLSREWEQRRVWGNTAAPATTTPAPSGVAMGELQGMGVSVPWAPSPRNQQTPAFYGT